MESPAISSASSNIPIQPEKPVHSERWLALRLPFQGALVRHWFQTGQSRQESEDLAFMAWMEGGETSYAEAYRIAFDEHGEALARSIQGEIPRFGTPALSAWVDAVDGALLREWMEKVKKAKGERLEHPLAA